ncbi:MAG TPA: flagellar biosynthetic protein FliO [Firmicutes bacterium]|nr:flagellar biosynthetic protein FliO [Bacillota bacterium]
MSGEMWGALGRILLYLPLVLLVCYLTVRFGLARLSGTVHRSGDLVLVERLAFGPKQGLAVVRCGNKHFLIGLGEASPRLLAELPDYPDVWGGSGHGS